MESQQTGADKVRSYKDLKIWQKGMLLTKRVYRLTADFPAQEKFGLVPQMRRAVVSIPSNIAEGQARQGTKEFVHFLYIASGSLAELETQLLLSSDLGFAKPMEVALISSELVEIQKMIAAIQRKLRARVEQTPDAPEIEPAAL